MMDNKSISNWVRQARYRASKKKIHSDLEISDVTAIIEQFEGRCAYCDASKDCWGTQADSLDHAFNISDESPNVAANVIPICKKMKNDHKGEDVASLLASGKITKIIYLKIVGIILQHRGGSTIKQYIKSIMGF
jgi:hypothetical protein